MSRKPNILLLADGASFHTERFYNEIKKRGHAITLASLECGSLEQITLEKKGSINELHYVRAVGQIKKIIREIKPNIISAHFVSGYGFIAALANRSFRLPLMTNLWGSDILIVPHKSSLHRWKTSYALNKADYIVADSQYLIDAAQDIHRFEKYSVIPWGIEQRHLEKHKNDYTFCSPLKIIVPRPHEPVYNNQFIIEALKKLLEQNKIEITFPNFGSQLENFKSLCSGLSSVKFYDKLERDKFLEFMASHDLYLSASTSDSSPVSLIEAMALGLLPVAANIKGVREWLDDSSGFPYNPDDPAHLYQIIQRLLSENNNHADMRKSNLEKVKNEAIFEKNIDFQLNLMYEMVK